MWKAIAIPLVVGTATGLGYFFTHYDVRREDGRVVITPRPASDEDGSPETSTSTGLPPTWKSIRLATFDIDPLDRAKLASPLVGAHLATLLRDFDVVAIQGIRAKNEGVLRELVDQVCSNGSPFDFAVPPEVSTQDVEGYNAFVFNRSRIDLDRSTVCSVEDPGGLFRRKPLLGQFRARGPAANEAFTFVLVNVQLDPESLPAGLDAMADVYEAVRRSRPGEDDVILLGDFAIDAREQVGGRLAQIPDLCWLVSGTVSTTRGTGLVDNLLLNRHPTTEFLGRAGVVDLVRRLNIDLAAAVVVAEHMPVWAEFSIYEGGQSGRAGR